MWEVFDSAIEMVFKEEFRLGIYRVNHITLHCCKLAFKALAFEFERKRPAISIVPDIDKNIKNLIL